MLGFAIWKIDGWNRSKKAKSPILFDTAGLEKFRLVEIKAVERAAEIKTGVM